MEIYTIIKRIIGNIEPYGDTNIDEERTNNLNTHINISYNLIKDLVEVAKFRNRSEYSIKSMGNLAYNELLEIKEIIDNEISQ